MPVRQLDTLRLKMLRVSVVFQGVLTGVGAMTAHHLRLGSTWEWLLFGSAAVLCFCTWPLLNFADKRHKTSWISVIGSYLVLQAGLLITIRAYLAMTGPLLDDPSLSVFRPIFGFVPFVYLTAIAVLYTRHALILCWLLCASLTSVVLYGLYLKTGFGLHRDGELLLLIWMLLGNPLMIGLLHSLPNFEDWLRSADSEVAEMRVRTQLLEKISAGEKRFNLVADSLQVGVWDQQFERGLLVGRWWSQRYYSLLGYLPTELSANQAGVDKIFGETALPIREAIYRELREKGISSIDTKLLTKDRGWRWFNISSICEVDSNGRFTRITGAIEDIHDRRIAEQSLLEAQAVLRDMAYRDPLTQLPNRRAFNELIAREWERARREKRALTLLGIDLDYFKLYNDRYGHPAGDDCLRQVSKIITSCVARGGDFAARIGGEEFMVLLPETELEGGVSVANEIESKLRQQRLEHLSTPISIVSCCIGVATAHPHRGGSVENLIERADRALYRCKEKGRACVTAAE